MVSYAHRPTMCDLVMADECTSPDLTIEAYRDALDTWFSENVKNIGGFVVIKSNSI